MQQSSKQESQEFPEAFLHLTKMLFALLPKMTIDHEGRPRYSPLKEVYIVRNGATFGDLGVNQPIKPIDLGVDETAQLPTPTP